LIPPLIFTTEESGIYVLFVLSENGFNWFSPFETKGLFSLLLLISLITSLIESFITKLFIKYNKN
jgi:hypothetical protein